MESDSTSSPRRDGLAAGAARGLAAGLGAGTVWWVVETVANWVLGGVISPHAAFIMLGLDLGFAAAAGLVVGAILAAVGQSRDGVALALGLTGVFGLIRVYEPPGWRAEALFVVLAAVVVALGVRVARTGRGVLGFVHVSLLATVATVLGKAGVSEVQSTYFAHQEPSGASLPLLVAGLPLAALVGDRIVAFLVRRPGLRLALELAAVALAAVVWGDHFSTAPFARPGYAAPAPQGEPDVVLLSLDTTRADHMSTYGYARETSPRLTEFAKDALNFTDARSPAQWTVPGHASMLTGKYPSSHGAHYAGGWHSGPLIAGRRRVFPLSDDNVTLAESLRAKGYATAGFVANFANLYRGFGFAQGFQYYEDQPNLLLRPVPHAVRLMQRFYPTFFKKPFRSARQVNAAALHWLDGVPGDRPAFLFLNYLEPHHWLAAPPYDRWARDLPDAKELALKGLFTHKIPAGLTPEEKTFVTANYDGQILAMDAAIGELMQALKKRHRYENALIIVTADHGELLGEHDIVGHGGRMMYEGLLHIPMVVKLPGADHLRGEIDAPVQLVDIVPTVLTTIGAPIPDGVQGQPLEQVTHSILAEEDINPEFVTVYGDVYNRALRVIYDGDYKLITTSRGEKLLFDLARDRDEMTNLAAADTGRVARMEERLEAAMSSMDREVAAASRTEGRP
jgi:arylsulfatase A-like enzyme